MSFHFITRRALLNNRGASLIYTTLALAFFAMMGVTVVSTATSDNEDTSNSVNLTQAEYASLAGLEWAKYQLQGSSEPQDPAVADKSFGPGSFTIQYTPGVDTSSAQITSNGAVGIARVSHSINVASPNLCFEFFGSPTYDFTGETEGGVYDIGFRKACTDPTQCESVGNECPDTVTVDKMTVSWTEPDAVQLVTNITIDGDSSASSSGSARLSASALSASALSAASSLSITASAADGTVYEQRARHTEVGSPENGAASGTEIDIENFSISDSSDHLISELIMSYAVGHALTAPKTFTIKVTFSDGSSKSQNFTWTQISEAPAPGVTIGDTPVVDIVTDTPSWDGGITDPLPGSVIDTPVVDIVTNPPGVVTITPGNPINPVDPVDPNAFDMIDVTPNNIQGSVDNGLTMQPEIQHGAMNNDAVKTVGTIDAGTQDIPTGTGTTSWFGTGSDVTNNMNVMTNVIDNAALQDSGATQNMQMMNVNTYTNTNIMNMYGH
jgi:hypothetical protein